MAWLSTFLLHPALFWFMLAASVPILLHLLTLHRLKTVELSTFRFLFDSYVQQRRRMQFLEALLAMLRTAFLALLVLAFCRPVVKHWSGLFRAGSGREVVLFVDCSASMNVATAGVRAIDRAKQAALQVVGRLHPDDRLTVVRVTSRPEEVVSRYSSDAETIRNKIEDLKVARRGPTCSPPSSWPSGRRRPSGRTRSCTSSPTARPPAGARSAARSPSTSSRRAARCWSSTSAPTRPSPTWPSSARPRAASRRSSACPWCCAPRW